MLRFKLHHLFAFSLLLTSWCQRPVQAMGVTFDLAAPPTPLSSLPSQQTATPQPLKTHSQPLPIPAAASQPPIRLTQTAKTLPHNVIASTRLLAPPPAEALPTSRVLPPNSPDANISHEPMGLSFGPTQEITSPTSPVAHTPISQPSDFPDWIYEGGSNSLVARVIGSAEGTRTPHGQTTRAYYGHTDPGNGVWNMGTFSYQHGARSPKEADTKQLKRLQRQGKKIAQQANQAEISITLGEILNGLDLANQAPRAALEQGGYIDRLAQARQKGISDSDAIIWARTYAYLDPTTQRWDAPGLGNTLTSIKRDQQRRHEAISKAFNSYQAQQKHQGAPPADSWSKPVLAIAPPTPIPPAVSRPISPQPEPISQQTEGVEFSMASQRSRPISAEMPPTPPSSPETVVSSTKINLVDSNENTETSNIPELPSTEAQS